MTGPSTKSSKFQTPRQPTAEEMRLGKSPLLHRFGGSIRYVDHLTGESSGTRNGSGQSDTTSFLPPRYTSEGACTGLARSSVSKEMQRQQTQKPSSGDTNSNGNPDKSGEYSS